MATPPLRIPTGALLAISALLLGLGAAPRTPAESSADQIDWATQALQRNSALEIVSVDSSTGVITVRMKKTGELRRLRASDLVAGPGSGRSRSGTVQARPDKQPLKPGERVLASGPGYRITTASTGAPASGASAEAPTAGGAALAPNLPVERRHEPIVCQGPKLKHLDSLDLEFDGNAIAAVDGCELYITNSRIVARGIAVAVRGASVHIDNSAIEGASGALEAAGGAQIYARSSTFKGLIRRFDNAGFHDMGGNVGN